MDAGYQERDFLYSVLTAAVKMLFNHSNQAFRTTVDEKFSPYKVDLKAKPMTTSFVPENFERVMGCTRADLLSWLPRVLPTATLTLDADNANSTALLTDGALKLRW